MIKHVSSTTTSTTISHLDEDCMQPNAVDIRLQKLLSVDLSSDFVISELHKQHRLVEELDTDVDDFYELDPGVYEFTTNHLVTVGANECGIIVPRSSLNRNGLYITSGLYDSGFNGYIAGILHVTGKSYIQKGTRIGQFVIFDSEMYAPYSGSYGINGELQERYTNQQTLEDY